MVNGNCQPLFLVCLASLQITGIWVSTLWLADTTGKWCQFFLWGTCPVYLGLQGYYVKLGRKLFVSSNYRNYDRAKMKSLNGWVIHAKNGETGHQDLMFSSGLK